MINSIHLPCPHVCSGAVLRIKNCLLFFCPYGKKFEARYLLFYKSCTYIFHCSHCVFYLLLLFYSYRGALPRLLVGKPEFWSWNKIKYPKTKVNVFFCRINTCKLYNIFLYYIYFFNYFFSFMEAFKYN